MVFFATDAPWPDFRPGYTGIAEERIEEGIRLLARLIEHERRG